MENAERAEIVMKEPFGVVNRRLLRNIRIHRDIEPVKLGDIVRVHDSNYIGEVKKACEMTDEGELVEYDADTHLSKESWQASVYAAGAVVQACEKVMKKEARNAF